MGLTDYLGKKRRLMIVKEVEFGVYLGNKDDKVLLPKKQVPKDVKVGDPVEFTGELMSVELGPGLLTQVFDGLQNPLPDLAEQCGFFLERGYRKNRGVP